MKSRKLNQWLWKWHFIAGIISLPFVLILSITGAIYLFKATVERPVIDNIQTIKNQDYSKKLTYQEQWDLAKQYSKRKLNSVVIDNEKRSTEFISGRFGGKQSVYVNPFNGKLSGTFKAKDTWMYTVRKLHGELLGGKIGTKLVELVASWMIVLILTGLYIWFPFHKGIKGVCTIRLKEGKRILFRDLHAVVGFWLSGLLLLTLAGGLPWTDVFGGNFKWIQKITNTGYPKTWSGRGLTSIEQGKMLLLDDIVTIAKKEKLEGVVTIGLPKNSTSTFSVSNKTINFEKQKMLHFDLYSGVLIKSHTWSDVGFLMRGRMWVMAFHQGEFGPWNWWLMFGIALGLTLTSIAAIFSYALRKPKKSYGIPKTNVNFKLNSGLIITLILIGLILPMFGMSLIIIVLYDKITAIKKKKISS